MFIYGGFDDKDVQVTRDCVRFVKELNSNQEEADTRMMLHVKYMETIMKALWSW